jgi:hypothetical protein
MQNQLLLRRWRVVHSREFREAEKKFPKYDLACRQLKHLCG